jgi:hypothetical protein
VPLSYNIGTGTAYVVRGTKKVDMRVVEIGDTLEAVTIKPGTFGDVNVFISKVIDPMEFVLAYTDEKSLRKSMGA